VTAEKSSLVSFDLEKRDYTTRLQSQ